MKKILLTVVTLFMLSFCFVYAQDSVRIERVTLSPENLKVGDTIKITIESQGYSADPRLSLGDARMRINYGFSDSTGDSSWDDMQIESAVGGKSLFYGSTVYYDSQTYNINVEVCYQKAGAGMSWNNENSLVCNTFTTSVTPIALDTGSDIAASEGKSLNPFACESLGECFDMIATTLFYFSIALVSATIIIAGILFLTGGTPARISLAKKILLLGIGIFAIMLLVKFVAIISKDYLTSSTL